MTKEWITDVLTNYQDKEFLIFRGKSYTYSDLIENINVYRKKLDDLSVKAGECIAIMGDYSPDMIFMLLALILNENIIVPVATESISKKNEIFSVAQVNRCFELNTDFEWIYSEINQKSEHPLLSKLRNENESGIIIFTSGTSGKSKAAVIQTARLLERYKNSKHKSFRSIVFLKMDHIGGINTLLSIIFNGGTIITLQGRNVDQVCNAIEKYRVELLPTTPTFLNMMIMSKSYKQYDLSSLKIISYGTEPMPQSTLEICNAEIPGIVFKQTYGLTELGIFSTKSKDSNSRWMKVGGDGVEVKIIDNILWIRAKTSMLGYLNADAPFDNEGWYNTGDEVEVDGEYIRILGRKSEVINVGGEKVYPAEVESVLLEIPNINDVLVTGKNNPITGSIVMATVVLNEPQNVRELSKIINEYCRERLQQYKIPSIVTISNTNLVSDRLKKMRNCVK